MHRALPLLLALALVPQGQTHADEPAPQPKAPSVDPAAKAVLDGLVAAYKALPGYSDEGTVTLVARVGDQTRTETQKARIQFARPDKLVVETDLVRLVSDGKTATAVVNPFRKYQSGPAPARFGESAFRNGPLGAIEFGGVMGLPLVHALNLVTGDDPNRLIFDFAPKLVAEPDREVDGKTLRSLRLDEADNFDWRFLVDPKTGLLAAIELATDADPARTTGSFPGAKIEQLLWTPGTIHAEAPAADRFTFQPPEGYTAISSLAEVAAAAGNDKPKKDEAHPLVGKPAPPFTLDALDGPDKLRSVALADLKGKVVVVDFWATWCGPCLAEMPDIERMIADYAKAQKPVAVVALSIDQTDAGDLKEARALVEKTLSTKGWNLDGNPVGTVALDPLGKVAKLYGVEAIPFVVVIDPAGTVRAVHVGVTRRETLVEEVDALLAPAKPAP